MSNLKGYQTLTTYAKKVGGPTNLVLLIAAGGAAIYGVGEFALKKGIAVVRKRSEKHQAIVESHLEQYEVTTPGVSNEGVKFSIGDKYKVLERDGNSILIEKMDDNNNPYFVSAELLKEISSFNK